MAPKLLPVLSIGAPFQPVRPQPLSPPMARNGAMQVIREPFKIVGSLTGHTYTTGNEDVLKGGSPELISIIPTDRPYAPQMEPGQQRALTGDELLALGYDPRQGLPQGVQYGTNVNSVAPAPQPQQPQTLSLEPLTNLIAGYDQRTPQQQAASALNGADPLAATRTANMQTIAAQQNVLGLSGADIAANRNVVAARDATIAPQQAALGAQGRAIDAQGNVISAQGKETAGTRQYIQAQQGANAARQSELNSINAAQANTADKLAVAQAANARANDAYKYQLAGLAQPQQVQVNPGQESQVTGPGTQAALETQADFLKRTSAQNEQQRQLTLDNARLVVSLLGTDTAAAQQAAARAGLTVDQAQLLVNQAQLGVQQATNAAALTGLNVQEGQNQVAQSRINEAIAGTPPFPGATLYTDPVTATSSWMTPDQAAQLQAQYQQQRATQTVGTLYTDPYTGQKSYKTPFEIDQLNADYERQFNISQAGTRYNPGDFGSMSDAAVYSILSSDLPLTPETIEAARQALYARNPNHADVDLQVKQALNTRSQRTQSSLGDAIGQLVQQQLTGAITPEEFDRRLNELLPQVSP